MFYTKNQQYYYIVFCELRVCENSEKSIRFWCRMEIIFENFSTNSNISDRYIESSQMGCECISCLLTKWYGRMYFLLAQFASRFELPDISPEPESYF